MKRIAPDVKHPDTMRLIETQDGIKGLLPYRSLYRLRAHGDTRGALAAQRVYRFKMTGESGGVWSRMVQTAAAELQCAAVWTVPGHDPDKVTKLQELFGAAIRRMCKVEKRKYAKGEPVDVSTLEFPPAPDDGGPVLLLDDVCTTGATLRAIRDHLAAAGIRAIPFALGINWKLVPPDCDADALADQWDAAAALDRSPTKYERQRARRKASSTIERRPVEDMARRERFERDPAAWLQWYLSAAFPLPFGKVHKDMIRAAVRAIKTGAGMAVAAPRGTGKTSVLWGVALWAILSGQSRFPVVAGWSHQAARRMLRKWIDALAENARLHADYPDACAPFQLSTHANRLKGCGWSDTGELCGADVQTMTGTIVLPDSIGALGAVSISGNTRGLSVGLPDGSAIRPDVLLLDDPQDKATAESPALVRKVIERIEADLFNLSGPNVRLSVMCAVTIISEQDVATHFLEHPDFEAVRVGQVTAWPKGWEEKESHARALWEEWDKARTEGLANHDGGKAARAFYKAHKAAMTAGMSVSWPARFDKKRKDPDALYAAMYDYYRLGERAFMAERQNEPLKSGEASLFDLPQSHVAARVNGYARRTAPDNAAFLVGMVDINADGLRWALAAASNNRALSVVDYGNHPGNGALVVTPGESETLGIMRGLSGLDNLLRGLSVMRGNNRMQIDCMLVDCGGTWIQAVFDWLNGPARQSVIPWVASRGSNSRFYRPNKNTIGRPGDNMHLAEWSGKGRVLVHNSDYWRHVQQKGWLLPVNAPDSISFFGSDGDRHEHFADGVVCERLVAFAETPAGPLYRWNNTPGLRNDWGDVATGLFVAASRLGLSPVGRVRPVVKKRRAPSISFVKT
jgi:hypothetical protein